MYISNLTENLIIWKSLRKVLDIWKNLTKNVNIWKHLIKFWGSEKFWISEIFQKSELFRTFQKFQINRSGVRFFSDVQNFSEPSSCWCNIGCSYIIYHTKITSNWHFVWGCNLFQAKKLCFVPGQSVWFCRVWKTSLVGVETHGFVYTQYIWWSIVLYPAMMMLLKCLCHKTHLHLSKGGKPVLV